MGRIRNYRTKSLLRQFYIAYYIGDKIEIVDIKKAELDNGRIVSELYYSVTEENLPLLKDIIDCKLGNLTNEQKDMARVKRKQQMKLYFEKKEQREKEKEQREKEKEQYKEEEFNAMLKAFMENDKELIKEFDKRNRKRGKK